MSLLLHSSHTRNSLGAIEQGVLMFDVIGFDADDTLWHNETLYTASQDELKRILALYGSPEVVEQALFETEMRNLSYFGYGIKSFTLSMVETAVVLSQGAIPSWEILKILDLAKGMSAAQTRLFEHVEAAVIQLAQSYRLMLITKGDLLDQEAKLARSGLSDHFSYVEIVSDKTPARYATILARHNLKPERFLMVGNSLKSDILPVLEIGGHAVYIPYDMTWAHEKVAPHDIYHDGYHEIEHIGLLPELVERLARQDDT
jgi:putative hydrolase of the HAD superfamily